MTKVTCQFWNEISSLQKYSANFKIRSSWNIVDRRILRICIATEILLIYILQH